MGDSKATLLPNATLQEKRGPAQNAGALTDPSLDTEISAVYDELAAALFRYAASMSRDHDVAREAVQETFYRFFLVREQRQPVLNPRAWLFRVLRNVLIDQFNERSDTPLIPLEEAEDLSMNPSALEILHLNDFEVQLKRVLSPRELDCVRLRLQGLQYQEIAVALILSRGGVSSVMSRAIAKLRQALP